MRGAQLLEHGLLRGSFVPPAPIRKLRSAYRDADEARRSIDSFIDEVYNRERLHSALAYLTPTEFEATLRTPASRSATRSKARCDPVGRGYISSLAAEATSPD